jgi:hypothetical protein
MTNPYAHDPNCDYWFDHYDSECTCSRPGWKPPAADPARELRAIRDEIAELKRRIERLEARVAGGVTNPADRKEPRKTSRF